ncbi:potassium-transporting ATPase subunit F [Leptospira adleri]|uniref:Potassium-transporting ATPase n=1 Tax=Leptospira adleri TaxID=2023186 RepID=A0A2M9YIS8_9LEPT|nr:potassium-transporting ATPase subunit F [Leptospira adleri]PJZ51443.1 potassium-transporting ATPase [Leptospira adleri]PJZ61684.1 potassium-transporting ATPase [Leptospira adleri]TGM60125.1 potassium-transporting ATPase subunit F [Leptospira adleri]
MNLETTVALILAGVCLVYLVYSIFKPEKF